MQNELEKFISANRGAFDGEEPGAGVWANLEKKFVLPDDKIVPGEISLEQFVSTNRQAFDSEELGAVVWNNIEKKVTQQVSAGDKLGQFITANRDAFDSEEPSEAVLANIEKVFVKGQEEKTPVIYRSLVVKIMSVAATVAIAAVSIWYFTRTNSVNTATTAQVVQPKKADTQLVQTTPLLQQPQDKNNITQPLAQDKIADARPTVKDNNGVTEADANTDDYNQEIFYYSKLTEIKFNELKKVEKSNPALYHSFAGEIKKLDSAYHGLQAMLKGNADKETVLAAMITNLKMQTEILSKQLYIIHSLKKSKKTENENKDKSI